MDKARVAEICRKVTITRTPWFSIFSTKATRCCWRSWYQARRVTFETDIKCLRMYFNETDVKWLRMCVITKEVWNRYQIAKNVFQWNRHQIAKNVFQWNRYQMAQECVSIPRRWREEQSLRGEDFLEAKQSTPWLARPLLQVPDN